MKKSVILAAIFFSMSIFLNAQQNSESFYYYQGEKFYLELDSTSFVIISEDSLSSNDIANKSGTVTFQFGDQIESKTKQNIIFTDLISKSENNKKIFMREVHISNEMES